MLLALTTIRGMLNDLKYFNGSIKNIDRIPESLKAKYATAFEIDQKWLKNEKFDPRKPGKTSEN